MTDIYYTGIEHKVRFLTTIERIGKIWGRKLDEEYSAALYILTADLSTWNKAEDYVDTIGIDFERMLQEIDFSGGHFVLIEWAWKLFNNTGDVSPVDLMSLDSRNFEIAISALRLRRSPLQGAALYNLETDVRNHIAAINREKPYFPPVDGE